MLKLNLVVIRTSNPATLVEWYSQTFDLKFITESHNDGILHYSTRLTDGLLEIYPAKESISKITFGFAVDKSDLEKIASNLSHKIIGENLVLLKDVDGNSIILGLAEESSINHQNSER